MTRRTASVLLSRMSETMLRNTYGILVSIIIATTAQFISEHYGAPAMLMALLLGMAFQFLSEEGRCADGIAFTSRTVLRLGVALLGVRISFNLLADLGPGLVGLVILGVCLTIVAGVVGAYALGRGWRFGLLTGGSVAICGASAAMAIAAVMPKTENSERDLTFTILFVTVLSTVAMVVYPMIAKALGFDDFATGVFIGGTIHDVAQVVGAGFSVSDATGETATLVKLIRVVMLAPVVFTISLSIRWLSVEGRSVDSKRPPLVPFFVIAFLILATANSLDLVSNWAQVMLAESSRWALLIAIAAVGMKTSLKSIRNVGGQAIILIVGETIFIAAFILLGMTFFSD